MGLVIGLAAIAANIKVVPCSGLASPRASPTTTTSGTGFGLPSKSLQQQRHATDTSPQVQKLVQFLQQQGGGAELAGTEIAIDTVNGRRGLYATKNWSKDKIICKIPSDMALALSDPAKNGEDAPTIAHGGANFLNFYKKNEQAAQQWALRRLAVRLIDRNRHQRNPAPHHGQQKKRRRQVSGKPVKAAER